MRKEHTSGEAVELGLSKPHRSSQTSDVQIVCVLGVHRSGTSAVTRVLNLLGVQLGPEDRLRKPAEANLKGFWEHESITRLNDEILSRLGGGWHRPPDFIRSWETSPELADLRRQARSMIQRDFGKAKLWGFKDPQTCLTLPFWRLLLPQINYAICLRNPVDVARSLKRRNGFSIEKSVFLWLTYVTSALEHTAGQPRLFVFYEDLMADAGREVRRLSRFLGNPELAEQHDLEKTIKEALEDELQHHRASIVDVVDEPKVAFPAKALYMVLRLYVSLKQAELSESRDMDQILERVLSSFSQYCIRAEQTRDPLSSLMALKYERNHSQEAFPLVRSREHPAREASLRQRTSRRNAWDVKEQYFRKELEERDRALEELRSRMEDLLRELDQVYQSLTWQLLRRFQRIEARAFPANSLLGEVFRALLVSLRLSKRIDRETR